MGDVQAWHFQHDVEDPACNPQPMTLLHAFVRDQLAERRELWLPGGSVRLTAEASGRSWTEVTVIADRVYVFESAAKEKRVRDVQPDIVFRIPEKHELALEVRYSHAVDAEKEQKLKHVFHDAIEFDVSDLSAEGITIDELEKVLHDRRRWKWLSWLERHWAESSFSARVYWEQREWRADYVYFREVMPVQPVPAAKLRHAQKRLSWAKEQIAKSRAAKLPKSERPAWLGSMATLDRLAVCCAAIGVAPQDLPAHFRQRVNSNLGMQPYAWQFPVFAKFGVGRMAFTARDVGTWAEVALPDCVLPNPESRTLNGFNKTEAAVHNYLLQLELQGLLNSDDATVVERRIFRPKFAAAADFCEYLEMSL